MKITAQNENAKDQNPLNYPYYIYGEQKVTGRNSSVLENIQHKGFSSKTFSDGTINGGRTTQEKLLYEFIEVTTNPEINLRGKKLQYWRQMENGDWLTDVESGNGIANTKLEKDACFILVLDESASMGENFNHVKNAAIRFINDLSQASSDGKIRIGIICFSSMDDIQIMPITPLTIQSKSEMAHFINKQHNENRIATALYHALNIGADMLVSYANKMTTDQYEGAYMLIFTDGFDNTSQIDEQQLYAINDVEKYVINKLKTTTLIKEEYIDIWPIYSPSKDVQPAQVNMMKSQLLALASHPSQFSLLDNITKLESTFASIAKRLTTQWQNLSCTSALNHNGPVCWTYGTPKAEAPKPIAPKKVKGKQMLLGLNVGIGYGSYSDDSYSYYDPYYGYYSEERSYSFAKFTIGIDVAYPITSNFGLGGYLSGGGAYEIDDEYFNYDVSIGALTMIGNHDKHNAKFLCGLGYNTTEFGSGLDARLGMLFRNGLYLMTDISTTSGFGITLNIGYNFGNLFKVK